MHTHSQHLERWLGIKAVESLSNAMVDWYGPPIALQGVPGRVYACKGGDFIGRIEAGSEVSALERADTLLRRSERARRILRGIQRRQSGGFADLTALRAAAAKGKRRDLVFVKNNNLSGGINASTDLYQYGTIPAAGSAGAAAPGGTVHTSADSIVFTDVSPATWHFVGSEIMCSVPNQTLLIYDRLFSVAKTMNSTATEAVTGVPTRYQSTTATDQDYIGGNFLFAAVGISADLAATAHNWTVCTYTDQGGNASTVPSFAGRSAAIKSTLDHPLFSWFAPLEAGDVGVKALTQMQSDAAVATGTIDFVIGHPIAWSAHPQGNLVCLVDGINTAFNLVRVFDGACLSFMELNKPTSTQGLYRGHITLVHS